MDQKRHFIRSRVWSLSKNIFFLIQINCYNVKTRDNCKFVKERERVSKHKR